MAIYKIFILLFGTVFVTGAGVIAYDLMTLRQRTAPETRARTTRPATGWSRPLSSFEAGIWLMGMWIFCGIITLGLLSFNLPQVREAGQPLLPYVCAWVGYPGLLLVTLLFVWRFTASLEARVAESRASRHGWTDESAVVPA